jgi:hypothetical protein
MTTKERNTKILIGSAIGIIAAIMYGHKFKDPAAAAANFADVSVIGRGKPVLLQFGSQSYALSREMIFWLSLTKNIPDNSQWLIAMCKKTSPWRKNTPSPPFLYRYSSTKTARNCSATRGSFPKPISWPSGKNWALNYQSSLFPISIGVRFYCRGD